MSGSFELVTDVAEIARLNARLGKQLAKTFRFKENREITYPAGHQPGTVYFESSSGTDVRAWSHRTERRKHVNFMLSGDPGSTKWIEIKVQLNFPAGTYNRMMAGAFVKDATGDVFIAHRGKLTKGNAGLPRDLVFREFASRVVEAEDNRRISRVILISALNDRAVADRLWDFADEARAVATRVGDEVRGAVIGSEPPTTPRSGTGSRARPPMSPADRLLKLKTYFSEYAGAGNSQGYGGGKRIVEHGDVVKALQEALKSKGSSQKAQAIDLAIVATTEVNLFEVKTSARTTDVYTAVGQLLIHGECIKELLGLPVKRYLVMPEEPRPSHGRHISRLASINVVTFEKVDGMYRFSRLP